ncbi:hypothetical protein DAEQUDRAFT_813234 [Daedalea quercina L-15889]|uniref:C2H2-type domain-containing protein n=1 Tax=Daedalea quercina L-15889 TaxID=1314783 RepID=A0A165NGJ1_9APHY|nr:hypothetical protein DAEQUDRAFT_813234 [Daedalea quercina L-15889]
MDLWQLEASPNGDDMGCTQGGHQNGVDGPLVECQSLPLLPHGIQSTPDTSGNFFHQANCAFSEDCSLHIAGPPVSAPHRYLAMFCNDILFGEGYGDVALAQEILEKIETWGRMREEGILQVGLQDNDVGSEASAGSHQDDRPSGGLLCKWGGCGRRIGSSPADVKAHLVEYHLRDIPEPPDAWSSSSTKLRCRWSECDGAPLLARSLVKHICGSHLKSNALVCPVQGCEEKLSRGDSLKRHLTKKHGLQQGRVLLSNSEVH